jgi:hypothetical protein
VILTESEFQEMEDRIDGLSNEDLMLAILASLQFCHFRATEYDDEVLEKVVIGLKSSLMAVAVREILADEWAAAYIQHIEDGEADDGAR